MNGVKKKISCKSRSSTELISTTTNGTIDNNENNNSSKWFDAESMPSTKPIENIDGNNKIKIHQVINNLSENLNDADLPHDKSVDKPEDTNTIDEKEYKNNKSQQVEALYENNIEIALNNSSYNNNYDKKNNPLHQSTCSISLDFSSSNDASLNYKKDIKRRHSSSVEISAMTSVKKDENGVPIISFSFLQTDDNKITIDDTKNNDDNDVYDIPKNKNDKSIEINESSETTNDIFYDSSDDKITELYDVPKSKLAVLSSSSSSSSSLSSSSPNINDNIVDKITIIDELYEVPELNKSLINKNDKTDEKKTNFHSFVDEDEDCDDDNDTEKIKNKRRLSKAWYKMRCWLRDEKLKIDEVVQRHSRLQAVGALQQMNNPSSNSHSGSYDLVEAYKKQIVIINNDNDISSVTEEIIISEVENIELTSYDKLKTDDIIVTDAVDKSIMNIDNNITTGILKNKTISNENIKSNIKNNKLTPVSFSLDKLNDDTEHFDDDKVKKKYEEEKEQHRHVGKGSMIKKRMLGSIRGLMASTNLLHQHDTEEVHFI